MSDIYSLDLKVLHLRCPSCRRYYCADDCEFISSGTGTTIGDLPLDFCATCPSCSASAPIATWVLCAHFPLDFFDTDNLCTCGGELWYTISKDHPAGAVMCDRCGRVVN